MVGTAENGASGVAITVAADERMHMVRLSIAWQQRGVEDWKRIAKYLPDASRGAVSKLKAGGWVIGAQNTESASMRIEAEQAVSRLRGSLDASVQALDAAAAALRFD